MSAWEEIANNMLAADGPAALVCRQWLMPAEGRDAVIFPPTFAAADGGAGKAGYNIDPLGDVGDPKTQRVAIIDTVGAQANRMEPLFKKNGAAAAGDEDPYPLLVPQIEIKAGNKTVNLLDAGHRAADAIVRYSALGPKLREAFDAYQQSGDATELAKIAPTSLVFGAWDSRDTQAKLPRLVASTIRAYDVIELKRSAQYNPPVDYIGLGLLDDSEDKKVLDTASELGFRHAPAAGTHGGVIVRGEIRREAILSLVGLRAIGPKGEKGEALRRYVLGLALVAMTYDREHNLRQGCLLVGDPDQPAAWDLVAHDGLRTAFTPDKQAVLAFAQAAAKTFGVGESRTVDFDSKAANAAIREKAGGRGKAKKGG
ncbi:MAG: type I-U CRISPR-associated RAMP protein Csb1/Cas7u [Xanthobacteraceae bacterium]